MRILVIENELSSRRGGQELSLRDVCRGLARRGHAIRLLYVTSGDLAVAYRSITDRMVRVRNYSVDRTRILRSLLGFGRTAWRGIRQRPDVVYANQYLDSLLASLVARACRVPFVCHVRLPPPDTFCTQYRIGMSGAARLIAISEQTRADWTARGFRRQSIDVAYNGIDCADFAFSSSPEKHRDRFALPRDAFVVTYAGRLHPVKGVETLIDAFAALGPSRDARLVIAGRPATLTAADGTPRDYLAELKERARARGVASSTLWIEHCHDVPSLFAASDVAVLPSLWSEPFGRVLIESMACGTPAVGSRTGGIPEILSGEFANHLFDAGDARQLAAALHKLKDWRVASPALAVRCREHVERHFSIERTVDQVERTLESAVKRAPGLHRVVTSAREIG